MSNSKKHIAGSSNAENERPISPSGTYFSLEEIFPSTEQLFSPNYVGSAFDKDIIVAIDTNALLLPYNIGKDKLTALTEVYTNLEAQNRLFLPARSAREFIKHRDRKLAEMIKGLNDKRSKIIIPESNLSPLLEGVEGSNELTSASNAMNESYKTYSRAYDKIIAQMRGWRGNDPVTTVYNKVFRDRVIDNAEPREELKKEWEHRLLNKLPPGYKDASKTDNGIGDFLIWKTLLQLGREKKKDLIFVTGEEKADWFVRSDGQTIYPRPELADEYRRTSSGKNIRLSTLHELLAEMNAPESVVKDILRVETLANNAIRSLRAETAKFALGAPFSAIFSRSVFDYSTNNGVIGVVDGNLSIDLKFNKASDTRIYLSRQGDTIKVARVKSAPSGVILDFDQYDSTSRTYSIATGEVFLAQNKRGETLVGRILGITDDSRGAEADKVTFLYAIFPPESPVISP